MITADGTVTVTTVNVRNKSGKVTCVTTPTDKMESVVCHITDGQDNKNNGKNIRKRRRL